MSKAFTDEESADSSIMGRTVVRAARGDERPMTKAGHARLLATLKQLVEEERLLAKASGLESEARLREVDHRIALIDATLESIRVVDPHDGAAGLVHFGSTVSLEWENGKTQRIELVGPDEVDAKHGRISFDSPLAKALLGLSAGESAEVERPGKTESVTITAIE